MISTKPVDRYTRPEFTGKEIDHFCKKNCISVRNFFIGIFYLIENGPLAIDSEQAINHIKRKYELENMEIVNKKKEKVRYDFVVFVECNFHQHVSN